MVGSVIFTVRLFDQRGLAMLAFFRIPRDKLRQCVRKILLVIVVGGVGAIVGGVATELVIRYLDEQGFFATSTQRAERVTSAAWAIVSSPGFLVPAAFVVGLTAGVWLDWLLRKLEGAERLNTLLKEGVRARNALLSSQEVFDCAQARAFMVEWSDSTVVAMRDAGVSLRLRSRFETLDRFVPVVFGGPDRTPEQIQLEGIWNKKLDLLREAIDTIGN